jgi:hypothetical protein
LSDKKRNVLAGVIDTPAIAETARSLVQYLHENLPADAPPSALGAQCLVTVANAERQHNPTRAPGVQLDITISFLVTQIAYLADIAHRSIGDKGLSRKALRDEFAQRIIVGLATALGSIDHSTAQFAGSKTTPNKSAS